MPQPLAGAAIFMARYVPCCTSASLSEVSPEKTVWRPMTAALVSGLSLMPVSTMHVTPGVAGVGEWTRNSACKALACAVGTGISSARATVAAAASALSAAIVVFAATCTVTPSSAQNRDADAIAQAGKGRVGIAVSAYAYPDWIDGLARSSGGHLVSEPKPASTVGLRVAELSHVPSDLAAKTDCNAARRDWSAVELAPEGHPPSPCNFAITRGEVGIRAYL